MGKVGAGFNLQLVPFWVHYGDIHHPDQVNDSGPGHCPARQRQHPGMLAVQRGCSHPGWLVGCCPRSRKHS